MSPRGLAGVGVMRRPSAGWKVQLYLNPFGTVAAIAAVLIGVLGMILGDGVSQGMTLSLHASADVTAHLWGVLCTVGGALKLYGLYAGRSTLEVPGLWAMTGGYLFYALTVVTGLGAHGLVAGIMAGAMTAGCLLKTRIIMNRARQVTRQAEAGGGDEA